MAPTYELIASNTLGSAAASVTFSAIPATYTDLVVKLSGRSNNATDYETIKVTFNNNTSSIYSTTRLILDSTGTITSSRQTGRANFNDPYNNGTSSTANTFSNVEFYIPFYTASQNKPVSVYGVAENNTLDSGIRVIANLFSSTAAISSIEIGTFSGSFVAGSSFFLYGIKNS
jgi:hypothetical protein